MDGRPGQPDPPPLDVVDLRELEFWDAHRRAGTGAVTAVGIAIAVVFALELLWGGSESTRTLWRMGANVPDRIRDEPWRLLSSAFLHIGFGHLLANAWALVAFGQFVEKVLGSARFVVLYAASALGGGALSAAVGRAELSAGASGAIWGLMAGGFVLTLRPTPLVPDRVRHRMRRALWPPLLLNTAISFVPGIDLFAHFGGGIAGALAIASGRLAPRPSAVHHGAVHAGAGLRLVAAVSAAALLGSLAAAWTHERPWELRFGPGDPTSVAIDAHLSIELPASIAAPHPAAAGGGADALRFGEPRRDPAIVHVRVVPLDRRVDPADRAHALAELRNLMAGGKAEPEAAQEPVVETRAGDLPAVTRSWRGRGGERYRETLALSERAIVRVDASVAPDAGGWSTLVDDPPRLRHRPAQPE